MTQIQSSRRTAPVSFTPKKLIFTAAELLGFVLSCWETDKWTVL